MNPPDPPLFQFEKVHLGDRHQIALILSISGTIHPHELPQNIQDQYTLYSVTPVLPALSEPEVISSPEAWANFERIMRHFFAFIEKEHGKLSHIAIFPAIPISCAIVLGRVLMPQVSPALVLFERNEQRTFFQALEVKR